MATMNISLPQQMKDCGTAHVIARAISQPIDTPRTNRGDG